MLQKVVLHVLTSIALALLLAGAKGFSLWRRASILSYLISKTTLLSDKRHRALDSPRRDPKRLQGHFQVRSILRSPEVTKDQILSEWRFFSQTIVIISQKYER